MEARIRMIGNAHLDPAWMWRWGEGMEAFIATCRSALQRMEENAEVVFTCSSAAHYRWVEEAEPELFARITERIAEGRWEVVGGWWTQADCNLPSGEGFVRQALLGQGYFIRKFGRPATVGYSPDAFGHNAGLPQLLAGSGLDAYIFCRPDPTELELPAPLFFWRSPDGSSVAAYRIPFHYNMYQTSVPKKVRDLMNALNAPSDLAADQRHLLEFGSEWALFYGVGNHGGGPTKEHIADIIAIDADPELPVTRFGRLDQFFNNVRAEDGRVIPEWRDDLQMNSPGCYSVHSAIKRLNRRAEHELVRAEILEALSALPTPSTAADRLPTHNASSLTSAWENICFNHFHDILCGVAIPEALEDAVHLYGESLSIADRTTRHAVRSIAGRVDGRGEGQTLLLINPHSFDFDGPVTFELWHDIDKELWSQPVDLRLLDDEGNEVPVGETFPSGKIGKDRVGGTFRAQVPAMGWRCWSVRYGEKSRFADTGGLIAADDTMLENEHLLVRFSPESGAIIRLHHKESGLDLIEGEGGMPVVIEDLTDTWGHGVTRFDRVIGRFDRADIRLVANGPTHATIRTTSRWGSSRVQQDFTLSAGSPFLSVRIRIFHGEPRTMLKLCFPTTLAHPRTVVQGAYAVVEKPCDGTERPGGAWKGIVGDIGGRRAGLGFADTLTHGYSADGGKLLPTLLRSPSCATHDPHTIGPDEDVRYIDMGEVEFGYTLRPFADEDFRTFLSNDAALLNAPLLLSLESEHDGGPLPLPRTFRGVDISVPNITMPVLKRAEDGNGWIVRLFETEGKDTEGTIRLYLLNVEWNVKMRGGEVKTFRIVEGNVRETDLIER